MLVPEPDGTTGSRFDPLDVQAITNKLTWMASLSDQDRAFMGERAAEIVEHWGPDRFAQGALEALAIALERGARLGVALSCGTALTPALSHRERES